jgi:hypothetical protein
MSWSGQTSFALQALQQKGRALSLAALLQLWIGVWMRKCAVL